jgi:hypothetical protein
MTFNRRNFDSHLVDFLTYFAAKTEILYFMYNPNIVPSTFKVISTQPEIKIQYIKHINNRIEGLILFAIFFGLPFYLLHGSPIFRVLLNPVKLFEILIEPSKFFGFLFLLSILGLLIYMSFYGLWLTLGSTKLSASREYLSITHNLLGLCCQESIATTNISYLELSVENEGRRKLDVVANLSHQGGWRLFLDWVPAIKINRPNSCKINLCQCQVDESNQWLGELLADFYRVELRSSM